MENWQSLVAVLLKFEQLPCFGLAKPLKYGDYRKAIASFKNSGTIDGTFWPPGVSLMSVFLQFRTINIGLKYNTEQVSEVETR